MAHPTNPSRNIRKPIEILNKIKDLAIVKKTHPLVVFDLDSTLFDLTLRLEKSLIDIASEPLIQEKFPNVIPYFKNIKIEKQDWGFVEVLQRAGVDHDHFELFKTVRLFWVEKFFSNEYIHYDKPYEGSMDFVQKVDQLKVPIVYLTGRDYKRMELGTREVLKKWNFPLDDKNSRLVMKPDRGMDDAIFKRDWIQEHIQKTKTSMFLFENEPVNINIVAKTFPDVELVFFDSTHSRKETAAEEIATLVHYLLED